MNRKVVLVLLGTLLVVVLIGVFIYLKMFVFGNSDYSNIKIESIVYSEKDVVIKGDFLDSDSAYKDYSYTLVGNELYLTINHVKVSNKYSSSNFEISLPVNGMITNIHLTDNKSTKVIFKSGQEL